MTAHVIPSSLASAEPRFAEPFKARVRRAFLGLAYAVRPKRLPLLPRVAVSATGHLLGLGRTNRPLPDRPVYTTPEGFVGVSDDLSVEHVLAAYRKGYYPMCHMGPMKWWSPAQRAVLVPSEAHVPKNVKRFLRNGKFRVTFDQEFARVVSACAEPRAGKTPLTWITPRIMRAFYALHVAGFAHSVEVWDGDGHLVGGVYGLAVGQVFFGESQFFTAEHASKVAIAVLHRHLAHWGFVLRDAKNMTPHLESLGFHAIDRASFEHVLDEHAFAPGKVGHWSVDPTLAVA